MELKLYSNNIELDLDSEKFEINLTSFNPLTGSDATRKYTSSISLPRSANNDNIFFAYRYPGMSEKSKVLVDAYIDGLFVDSFSCVVSVKPDSYTIQLVPVDASLTSDSSDFALSNDKSLPFYRNEGREIDLFEMIKYYFPTVERQFDYSNINPVIIPTYESLIKSEHIGKELYIEPTNKYWSFTNNEWVAVPPFVKFSNEDVWNLATAPDEWRLFSFNGNNGYVLIEDSIQSLPLPDVYFEVKLRSGMTDKIFLTYEYYNSYYRKYNLPLSFGFEIYPDLPLEIKLISTGESQRFVLDNCRPILTGISGSNFVKTGTNAGLSSKLDVLKAYSQVCGVFPDRKAGKVILKDYLTSERKDWSSKIVEVNEISDANGGAMSKRIKYGYATQEVFTNSAMHDDLNDLSYIFPLSKSNEEPTTTSGLIFDPRIDGYTQLFGYFDSDNYKDKLKNLYAPFAECVEVEAEANLNIFDIIDFDQTIPVWIESLRSYFYVLSISGWSTKSGNCKVKLLKLK